MKQLITTLPTKVYLSPMDRVQIVGANLSQLDDDFSLIIDVINTSNFEATNFVFAVKFYDAFGKYLFDETIFEFSSPETKVAPHSLHYFDPFVLDERFHTARQVEIRIKSVFFGDKAETVYDPSEQSVFELPLIDPAKQTAMKEFIAPDCITYGENLRTAWRCVCGATNLRAEFECDNCHRNKFYVLNQLTEALINQKIAAALDPNAPLEESIQSQEVKDHIPQTTQIIQKIRTPDKKSFTPRSLKDYLVLFLTLVLILVSLFFAFHLYKGSGLYQHRQVAKADRLIEEGQFEKAKEVYRSLANNPPEDLSSRQEKLDSLVHSQFHYEMGLKAMDQEDPFSALTYFNKVLPEDLVRYNKAHQYIGNLEHQILKQSKDLLQEGQVDEAVDLLHRLLDILPKSAEGLNLLDNILNEENISPDQRNRLNEIKDLEKIQEEKYKPKTPEEEKRGHLTKKAEDLLHSYQTVVEDQANLRESPSLDAKILHHLPKNSSVYIYETSIEKTDRIWCKVQIQTPEGAMYEGWVSSRILGDQ